VSAGDVPQGLEDRDLHPRHKLVIYKYELS
jgi:hypothetical protein